MAEKGSGIVEGGAPQAILKAATRLFASKGFDAASVREIAESAGVAKPTIYYHFGNKEGLFEHLVRAGTASLVERLKAINTRPSPAGARECLEDAVWSFFEFTVQNDDLIRFIHSCVFGPSRHPMADMMAASHGEVVEQFRLVLVRAVESGLLDARRVQEAALALRGALQVCVFNYLHGRAAGLPRSLAAALVEGFLYGYGAR